MNLKWSVLAIPAISIASFMSVSCKSASSKGSAVKSDFDSFPSRNEQEVLRNYITSMPYEQEGAKINCADLSAVANGGQDVSSLSSCVADMGISPDSGELAYHIAPSFRTPAADVERYEGNLLPTTSDSEHQQFEITFKNGSQRNKARLRVAHNQKGVRVEINVRQSGWVSLKAMGSSGGGSSGGSSAQPSSGGNDCRLGKGVVVKEGQGFWEETGCQFCRCSKGRMPCPEAGCVETPNIKKIGCLDSDIGYVVPFGQSYKQDCNTCTCKSNGEISCTEIGCG